MSSWRQFVDGLRILINRKAADRDIADEVDDYLEQAIAALMASGLSLDEARRSARLELGNRLAIREQVRSYGWENRIETLLGDLRFAGRRLRKSPGFTAVCAMTLALGIGTSTALFSVVESQLWRPLPFPESNKLLVICERNLKKDWQQTSVSAPDFGDWRESVRTFENLGAMQWARRRNFAGNGMTERPETAAISAEFFSTLRIQPEVGRSFSLKNEKPGEGTEAVITGRLAKRTFGSAQAALGRTIKLDGERYSVIGVLPDAFRLEVLPTPDVFVPLTISDTQSRDARDLLVIGRLRSGVAAKQALADIETVARRLAAEHPDTNGNIGGVTQDLREAFVASATRTWLLLALTFAVFVLLIACANVSILQLMRAVTRQREFAVREALGASRGAMLREAVAESAWLAVGGAVAGVLLALGIVRLLQTLPLPDMLPRESGIFVDACSLAFVAGTLIVATFVFGLAPGFFGSRINLEAALRASSRGASDNPSTRRRIGYLTGFEVALAFVSLFGSGLFAFSCWNLQCLPLGFDPKHVLALQVPLAGARYLDQKSVTTFWDRTAEQLSQIPGIQEFAISDSLPLMGGAEVTFTRTDQPKPPHGSEPFSVRRVVTPSYFHLLGIPILRGRSFSDQDRQGSQPVAIVNQNLAKTTFGTESPLGKQLLISDGGVIGERVEIVGVAANSKEVGLDEVPFNDLYVPASQSPSNNLYALVKANSASAIGPILRLKMTALDPDQFVGEVKPLDSYVEKQLRSPRFSLGLVLSFATLALLLTGVALSGAMSFSVAQQSREIGVRIALGARRGNVLGLILRRQLRLTIAGSIAGVGAALLSGAMLGNALYMVPHQHEGILYGVSIRDPISLILAAIVLVLLASIAGMGPALRAARIDPNLALRSE